MNMPDWEPLFHRVADRVFHIRGRVARMRWPGAYLVQRLAPRTPTAINWGQLVTGVGLWKVVRRSSRALAMLALVALIGTGGFRVVNSVRAEPPKIELPKAVNVYYFDLGTEKLYTASSDSPLPMKAPSGALGPNDTLGGVRAHVFACHSCADANDRFIGYIETADTPSDQGTEHTAPGITPTVHYVSKPEADSDWAPATSPPGLSIANEAQTHCGPEKTPKYCTP